MAENVYSDLDTAPRILLGPGPSMVSPRVLRIMATPLLGHLDPQFILLMGEVQELLRKVFQTKNELTLPVSGTGSAGMESALCNFIEPGDRVLVASIGYFGDRLAEMAGRHGAEVDRLELAWGQVLEPEQVEAALQGKNYKLLAMVHAETSTGTWQPGIAEFASAAHRHGALLVLDTVTSLGGIPVEIDAWDVDVAYSASQKCLSAPSGMAPITVSERAREVLHKRKTPVDTWYLDLTGLEKYWGQPHAYHHTAPISMVYAMREALRLVVEEGLEDRFFRHKVNAELLWAGLDEMDLPPLMPHRLRLPTLTTPQLPVSIDDAAIRSRLLNEFNIEIAGGFGPLKGKVWRIGLMGFSSRRENVALLLEALRQILTATD